MIDNEENLTEKEIKSIKSIERRLKKIAKEIEALSFNVALHGGTLSILKGEPFDKNDRANYKNIKCDITVGNWSGVDW